MKQSSPFLDTSYPMTAYEWFKLILLLPWTILKLPIALIGFILVWSITKLMILGSPINQPLSPARSRMMRPFLSFWADILMRLGFSFWRLPIKGKEHIKAAEDARAIIAFNHVSYMDPYVMVKVSSIPERRKANTDIYRLAHLGLLLPNNTSHQYKGSPVSLGISYQIRACKA